MQLTKELFELIFPRGLFDWFDLIEGKSDEQNVYVLLEEKDLPPLDETNKDKKIVARKFHEITITDFPLRGRRTLITLRRRYWKLEGEEQYLKRDIQLTFPGTQLETEFANFLKEAGGRDSGVALIYRPFALPPDQGV